MSDILDFGSLQISDSSYSTHSNLSTTGLQATAFIESSTDDAKGIKVTIAKSFASGHLGNSKEIHLAHHAGDTSVSIAFQQISVRTASTTTLAALATSLKASDEVTDAVTVGSGADALVSKAATYRFSGATRHFTGKLRIHSSVRCYYDIGSSAPSSDNKFKIIERGVPYYFVVRQDQNVYVKSIAGSGTITYEMIAGVR